MVRIIIYRFHFMMMKYHWLLTSGINELVFMLWLLVKVCIMKCLLRPVDAHVRCIDTDKCVFHSATLFVICIMFWLINFTLLIRFSIFLRTNTDTPSCTLAFFSIQLLNRTQLWYFMLPLSFFVSDRVHIPIF